MCIRFTDCLSKEVSAAYLLILILMIRAATSLCIVVVTHTHIILGIINV